MRTPCPLLLDPPLHRVLSARVKRLYQYVKSFFFGRRLVRYHKFSFLRPRAFTLKTVELILSKRRFSLTLRTSLKYSTWLSFWCILAYHSHIFTVPAVVTSPPTMTTLCDACFIAGTMDIIQPNLRWCSVSLVPTTAMRTPSSL